MAEQVTIPRPEDVVSVGSRISWGAIFAGAVLALGLYSLLAILGSAVGLSISERLNPTTLKTAAISWTLVTIVAALFVGGMVTSQFTVGENKTEAMLYGVIMWALVFGFLAALSAAGVHAGLHTMVGMANTAQIASTQNWETGAREAGVPSEQIEEWRRKLIGPTGRMIQDSEQRKTMMDAATRLTWYAFAGAWLSMLAAALGAWLGAGSTFRILAGRSSRHVAAT
jgi:hypothetical protein